ncbi:MATE family efflux transporter [Exilibacterium tricleocarpae]|uniref:Multidrug-efflux transporter n=1 Tax=Exilibacterium tricleocarpae TaxID=2591008 RepID=A0A545TSC3_9GAMM|nr:MATE family efflux transporter [Exilibacterium tricleocarpae]TQV80116.1 MATE family efflux transporter [Exilibacterium tricleocarpae]
MFKNVDRRLLHQCWALAWPVSLQSILVAILGMVDVMMVGHLGDVAVASVGLGSRAQFVLLILLNSLAIGSSVLAAQLIGARQPAKVRQMVVLMGAVSLVLALPLVLAALVYAGVVVSWASNDAAVIATGARYLHITLPSIVPVCFILIFEGTLRGMGQVKLPLVFGVVAIALNILLNYWLINGGLGVEPLGVAGAAWATNIARVFHLFLLAGFLWWVRHLCWPGRQALLRRYSGREWSRVYRLVVPMALNFGVWSAGAFVYHLIYGQLGTRALATISMLAPIEGAVLSAFVGLASACAVMVGQRLGANEFEQAFTYAKNFTLAAPVLGAVIGLLMVLGRDLILLPYGDLPAQTQAQAKSVLVIIAAGAWLKVISVMLSLGVLRAGGDNRYCLFTDLVGMWLVGLPAAWFAAAAGFALPWVVVASYAEDLAKVLLFGARARGRRWMRNLVADGPRAAGTPD